GTNLHLAFDTELLRTHSAWAGPSLNLYGPPYHGGKDPFICTYDGATLWTMPQEYPWSFALAIPTAALTFSGGSATGGESAPKYNRALPAGARFRAISTDHGGTSLLYDIAAGGGRTARVNEQARRLVVGHRDAIVRRFELSACDRELRFLAHAELGSSRPSSSLRTAGPGLVIARSNDFLLVNLKGPGNLALEREEHQADYWQNVITEAGTEAGWPRVHVQGRESRVYVRLPAHQDALAFQILSLVCADGSELRDACSALAAVGGDSHDAELNRRDGEVPPPKILDGETSAKAAESGDAHYRVEHFPLPKEANLMVTGMDFLPAGDLAVCTWPGEVWIVENVTGPAELARYRRFARGLNEPLGLKVIDGRIYVVQKCELTRLSDTDGDGAADLSENVNDAWGYTGSYHAFTFGPMTDAQGNLYVALCAQRGRWDVPYLGWTVKISSDGQQAEGFCNGLRAPNGFANFGPGRDLFVTDNEGNWIGACKLNHLERGQYYGFPSATPAPKEDWGKKRDFKPPAVWFPKRLAPSASGLAEIADERFGPFGGQMMVGDFQNATVLRVMLERVQGAWQGTVWPFARGFFSGVNRLAFGPDGKLYVGGLKNKAWPALGPREYSLERVSFTGTSPFEVQEVRAQPNGFELRFTEPVDRASSEDAENYVVSQFNYEHHEPYGSPEFDHNGQANRATEIKVLRAEVSPDARAVRLSLAGLKTGFVTHFRCGDLKSARSRSLRHRAFFYTLNHIPSTDRPAPETRGTPQ
ncbi:MAG: PQQ-dependent sugar dehydrogenase, partial [Verrucomicrobiales bacterium]|nr:PQQ-dependent sugar dehydrogenase [Verrucomicrobiales bacterium]